MYISKINIINYRNFSNATFKFNKGVNTIIGENGAGKTNLFQAMRLLLDDSLLSFAYKLDSNDFNRQLADWRGHWIIISIEFSELSSNEAVQSLFIHQSGDFSSDDIVTKATYTLYFRPKAEIRKKLSDLSIGDSVGLEKILSEITPNNLRDTYETFITGKSTADFSDPEIYNELVGDFDSTIFPHEIDQSKYGAPVNKQLSLAKEISFTFIKALRDVVSDFQNNRTNPLLSLLRKKSDEINPDDYKSIVDKIDELNTEIETLPDVEGIKTDIKKTIKEAVGETYAPSSLSIKSNLPSESAKILQSLKLFIGEPDESYEGGIQELSLGGANLIYLTLKLLEYQYDKSKTTLANFLVIEEPEAHIHTHIQKTLFDKIDFKDTQIIYSTHSPQIAEVSNILNINILSKKSKHAEVYQPSTGLGKSSIIEVQRYLDAVRSNLLFAKAIILVEGDAEEILIPAMVKKVLGLSLDELGISLINIRSTGFENIAQLFHGDRVKRKCAIVTDSDTPIIDIEVVDGDSESLIKFKEKQQGSAEAGRARKSRLDTFSENNEWVSIRYANHTFEVDFIASGNAHEAVQTLSEIYSKQDLITKAKNELESTNVGEYGRRILKMAEKSGKGWFALKLVKQVSFLTNIPDYILNAILFVRPDLSRNIIYDIIKHRLKEHKKHSPSFTLDKDIISAFQNFRDGTSEISDLLDVITKHEVDDFLETILKKLNL